MPFISNHRTLEDCSFCSRNLNDREVPYFQSTALHSRSYVHAGCFSSTPSHHHFQGIIKIRASQKITALLGFKPVIGRVFYFRKCSSDKSGFQSAFTVSDCPLFPGKEGNEALQKDVKMNISAPSFWIYEFAIKNGFGGSAEFFFPHDKQPHTSKGWYRRSKGTAFKQACMPVCIFNLK